MPVHLSVSVFLSVLSHSRVCEDSSTFAHYSKTVHQHTQLAQGDHLSGKPGNVREFENISGKCQGKILSG